MHRNVYEALKYNPKIKAATLADNIGVSERTITRIIADLKALNLIGRKGGYRHGEWIIKNVE
ncbi:HTH domain-containing protein [Bacteroides sp.]|uniref:HTH domain-containing protein n=1 Tax=Bacteroides sp. TaxID=29523 RepID=UPI00262C4AE0|nr:HTH domain-containing protein [Bacteroides sp.]